MGSPQFSRRVVSYASRSPTSSNQPLPEVPALERGLLRQSPFFFWEIPKNILKKMARLSPSPNGRQPTTIHHELTTTSPRKHNPKNRFQRAFTSEIFSELSTLP
jgi:hypothetical protein